MKIFFAFILSVFTYVSVFAQSSHDTSWKIVKNENVCMVTEMYFNKPQIPVKVAGKTYYGCCENCKQTLTNDAKSRSAIDPVSKKSIDKATAVIAANDVGSVLYFSSKDNFEKYIKMDSDNRDTSHMNHQGH